MMELGKNKHETILVKKASGEEQVFDISKLQRSLHNAGAEGDIINEIVADIEAWIVSGITTKKIYSRAFQLLNQKKTSAAIYYRLKQAIMELGPTGYPFETFIGKIFEKEGYKVQVGQVLEGFCITHEMDVIATNKTTQHLVECKYRTAQEKNISIQVPLYVRARIDDIIKKRKASSDYQNHTFEGWIVTNTRFSPDSVHYAKCSGLHLLGWDYPVGHSLKEIIEKEKLYPLTVLKQLLKKHKQELLEKGLVLCSEILAKPGVLDTFNLSKPKFNALMKELSEICS
jgi:hypothetical protein